MQIARERPGWLLQESQKKIQEYLITAQGGVGSAESESLKSTYTTYLTSVLIPSFQATMRRASLQH